jgi:hypothetical protein
MRRLAVVAESLAVVRGDDRQRRHAAAKRSPTGEQPAELLVRERNLAVIRTVAKRRAHGIGCLVGGVRIEEMHPCEDGAVRGRRRPRLQPGDSGVNRRVRSPLDVGRPGGVAAAGETIVVGREAPVEAESVVHRKARDERRGFVAGVSERLRHGRREGAEHEPRIVADAVNQRRHAGQDARVRWQRQRDLGNRVFKADALARQPVQYRRGRAAVTVTAEVIRTERVDGDEEHVRSIAGSARDGTPPPPGPESHEHERRESREEQGLRPTSGCAGADL